MGSALTCPSSNNQNTSSKFPLCNIGLDKSCSGHEIVNSDIVENNVNDAPSNVSEVVTDFDDLAVKQLGIATTDFVNICGSHVYQECNVPSNYQDESLDQNETKHILDNCECQSRIDSSSDLDESSDQNEIRLAGLHKNVSEHFCGTETLDSLDEVQVFPSIVDEIGQLTAESLAELTTTKLVSALKGSRAQRGLPVTKLCVKWAPDVYDPPVTLTSHTVKGHQRRTKSMKEYSKHKNGKGKSLRRGVAEKKLTSRRKSNFVDPRTARYGVANGVKVYDSSSLPALPALDYMP